MEKLDVRTVEQPPKPRKRTKIRTKIVRILVITLSVLLILTLFSGGFAFWFVQRTLPQIDGTISLHSLQNSVNVARDQWGVPHLTASTLHDAIFAQGYVTAQDRLFQMEINRRLAQGRLAELFGAGPDNSLVNADAFARTLGLYRVAQAQVAHLDAQTKADFQAYADGVNAFITTHPNTLPLEYSLLGVSPEPWTIADSLACMADTALSLDNGWYLKYTRALVLAKEGPSVTNALFPAYPQQNPTLFTAAQIAALTHSPATPSGSAILATSSVPALTHLAPNLLAGAETMRTLLGSVGETVGSNDWVVDGTKTVTGKPLLANDPHLGINMPSTWYEIGLRGGNLNVIGFSFPGYPGVLIGHNDHIAWGVTNVGADDADLYLETLDPAQHQGAYLYNGKWLPLQSRQETIRIHGSNQPVVITVSSTLHGPLLNTTNSDLQHFTPVALKWTALQADYNFAGGTALDFATNWPQFLQAVSSISLSQNFVYADVQGNIGYRMSGLLPIRASANDLLPVDGSTSADEWHGYVPQEQMPTLFNPPSHMIVTANNQIVPDSSPIYVAHDWDQGYRARRISDLLATSTSLTIADDERIQADVYSIPAATLTPYYIAAGLHAGGDAKLAATLLQGWNAVMGPESVAASVYEVATSTLLHKLFEPVLGIDLYNIYSGNSSDSALFSTVINLVLSPTAPFFGITAHNQANAQRDALLQSALSDAISQLRSTLGTDTTQWQWGQLHQAHFDHPLTQAPPLNLIFGVNPVARPGDSVTVNVGGTTDFSADPADFDQHTVASMREIIDLANLDQSLWIITTGESGQPFSAHYDDLLQLWNQNRYQTMDFSPQAEARATKDQLILQP